MNIIDPCDLPWQLFEVGDIVSRDGNDEQEIIDINEGGDLITVRCIKEPPVYEGSEEPWIQLGEEDSNVAWRYEFIRKGNNGKGDGN